MTATGHRPRRVLIAGGGPAALETAFALREHAGDRVAISLLTPTRHFVYAPESVAEPFGGRPARRISLAALTQERGFELHVDAVTSIDVPGHALTTASGARQSYDALVLALGARPALSLPGAVSFSGPADTAALRAALEEAAERPGRRVAFVAPSALTWTLPLYELALMASDWTARRGTPLDLWVVTPEARPLGAFGAGVSTVVSELLARAEIRLWTSADPEAAVAGQLLLGAEGALPVDLAVALPLLTGRALPGLRHDRDGFTPVDAFGRVPGAPDVYAVGDMTTHPVKQGGLATQQADAAASALAAWAGADVAPVPYRPQLRAKLLTRDAPWHLQRDDEPTGPGSARRAPRWRHDEKIVSRHLSPYLLAHSELETAPAGR